jgi:hypothetical protein
MTARRHHSDKQKLRWYNNPSVAITISVVGFVLSVFPTWYPIVSDWMRPNFVGVAYAFDSIANPVLPMKTGIRPESVSDKNAWTKICISTSIYIEITNNTPHPLSIQGFEVQQETSGEKWVSLDRVRLVDPYIVEVTMSNSTPSYFDYSSNYFDKLIGTTTLQPGVPLQGWTFLSGACSTTAGPRFLQAPWRWWPPSVVFREVTNGVKGGRIGIFDTQGGKTYLSISAKQFTGANETITPTVKPAQTEPVWAKAGLLGE